MKIVVSKLHALLILTMMGSYISLYAQETPYIESIYLGANHHDSRWTTDGEMTESSIRLKQNQYVEISALDFSGNLNPKIKFIVGSSYGSSFDVYASNGGSEWVKVDGISYGFYGETDYAFPVERTTTKIKIQNPNRNRTIEIRGMDIWDFGEIRTECLDYTKVYTIDDFQNSSNGTVCYNYDGSSPQMTDYYNSQYLQADFFEINNINIENCIAPGLIVKYYDYLDVEYSTDGIHFSPLKNTNGAIFLPQNTKTIRLARPKFSTTPNRININSVKIIDYKDPCADGSQSPHWSMQIDISGTQITDGTGETFYQVKNIPSWISSYELRAGGIEYQKIDDHWYVETGSRTYFANGASEVILTRDPNGVFELISESSTLKNYPRLRTYNNGYGIWYDINGDGNLDYIDDIYKYYLQSGDGTLTYKEVQKSSGGIRPLAISDWNQDGDPDILTEYGVTFGIPGLNLKGYKTPSDFNEITSKSDHFVSADVDNDGHQELLFGCGPETQSQNRYLKINTELEGLSYPINVNSASKDGFVTGSPGEPSLPSVGNGMFVGNTTPTNGAPTFAQSIDITGDGIPEIVNEKEILMNVGNGNYQQKLVSGDITLQDFNGDGILDYIGNDTSSKTCTLFLIQPDGQDPKEVTLLSGVVANKKIYCFDFDKDGDVDILIPCDRIHKYHDNGAAYLIVMENKGNGSFKRHENYLDGEIYFYGCTDLNADGTYEVIYYEYSSDANELKYVSLNGVKDISNPTKLRDVKIKTDYPTYTGNFTNDGHVYFGCSDGFFQISSKPNTKPTSPSLPKAVYDKNSNKLHISWGNGSDQEASEADLTYAMRIGTTPEGQEMMWADALADGTRRNILDGNMGHSHYRVIDVSNWPKGKYYISVQAIDPHHSGSAFSQAAVFEKDTDIKDFEIASKNYYRVGQ